MGCNEQEHCMGCKDQGAECVKPNPMTPAEFALRMVELRQLSRDDPEFSHMKQAGLMCEVLVSLGYERGVHEFWKSVRWYA